MRWTGEVNEGGCLVVECEACRGTGEDRPPMPSAGPDWCGECGGTGEDYYDPRPVLRACAFAAALTLAYRLGDAHGWRSAEYERGDDGGFDPGYGNWWPNVRGEATP